MSQPDELQRLQQATAADAPADVPGDTPCDAETASLREGWLALGQLIEAAEPSARPLVLAEPLEQPARVLRWQLAAAALAASLIVGGTLVWTSLRNRPSDVSASPSRQIALPGTNPAAPVPTLATPHDSPATDAVRTAAVAAADTVTGGGTVEEDLLSWEDPLDDEIALVSREVILMRQDSYRLDNAYDPVRSGIEQIEQEFDDNTL